MSLTERTIARAQITVTMQQATRDIMMDVMNCVLNIAYC
jgi:hypothetical protein